MFQLEGSGSPIRKVAKLSPQTNVGETAKPWKFMSQKYEICRNLFRMQVIHNKHNECGGKHNVARLLSQGRKCYRMWNREYNSRTETVVLARLSSPNDIKIKPNFLNTFLIKKCDQKDFNSCTNVKMSMLDSMKKALSSKLVREKYPWFRNLKINWIYIKLFAKRVTLKSNPCLSTMP